MPGMETYPVAEKEIYVSEIIKDFFQSVIYTKGRLISLLNRDWGKEGGVGEVFSSLVTHETCNFK